MKRFAYAAAVGTMAVALLGTNIAPASAARIGPKLPVENVYGIRSHCIGLCTFLQPRPAIYKARSDGTITRFRVQCLQTGPSRGIRLQVLRPEGGRRYQALHASDAKQAHVGLHSVATFRVHLRVHAGDVLALRYNDSYLWPEFCSAYVPGASTWVFHGLSAGETGTPVYGSTLSDYGLVFNAHTKR